MNITIKRGCSEMDRSAPNGGDNESSPSRGDEFEPPYIAIVLFTLMMIVMVLA